MEIYLDHAATTWVYPQVADLMKNIMCTEFGNPSSMHKKGYEAEKLVRESAKTLAQLLKVSEKEIYFTSGGTESNNWALAGAAQANRRSGRRILTSAIEHPSVSGPLAALEKQGFEVIRIGVDGFGRVNPEELAAAVNEETILVSVMMVNNEIGTLQDIAELSRAVKAVKRDVLFHVDAIQAFGKYVIRPKQSGIDLLSVSGHKIHGPKGSGFLYASGKAKLLPLIFGGGQQNGMRSGTDNVPGIAGLANAAGIMYDNLPENVSRMEEARNLLVSGLSEMENVFVNGPCADREEGAGFAAPHIVNASFPGIRSEVLLHSLEERGIYVSAGSACSSHKRAPSATLSAIGCSREALESAVRFSFCEQTTTEEINRTLCVLKELVPVLRRYQRH